VARGPAARGVRLRVERAAGRVTLRRYVVWSPGAEREEEEESKDPAAKPARWQFIANCLRADANWSAESRMSLPALRRAFGSSSRRLAQNDLNLSIPGAVEAAAYAREHGYDPGSFLEQPVNWGDQDSMRCAYASYMAECRIKLPEGTFTGT